MAWIERASAGLWCGGDRGFVVVVEGEVLVDVVAAFEIVGGVVEDASPDAVPCVMGVRSVMCVVRIMCLRRIHRAACALDGVWDVDEGGEDGMVLAYEHVEWIGVRGVYDALGFDVEVRVGYGSLHWRMWSGCVLVEIGADGRYLGWDVVVRASFC